MQKEKPLSRRDNHALIAAMYNDIYFYTFTISSASNHSVVDKAEKVLSTSSV